MFDAAITEARRVKLPFVELMLARDSAVAANQDPTAPGVLRRLGRPLQKLPAASPAELDPLLGHGFSTAAALHATAGNV